MKATRLTDEQIRSVLETLGQMLHEPTCQVTMTRGVKRINDGGPWWTYEPTDGCTVTITVHGGAVDITEHRVNLSAP